jgi:hypothetical protein
VKITTILLAYNRPDHFKQLLSGVRREGFNKLKVYIDGPKNEYDRQQQLEIMKELSSVDWADICIIRRKESHGLARSITMAVSETLEESESVIVLEDDCVPRKGFKKYMETMLHGYMGHKEVSSICGYSYPCYDPNELTNEFVSLDRFCPWGWATWSHKWRNFIHDLREIITQLECNDLEVSKLGKDIESYCHDSRFLNQKMDIWSLNWILSQYLIGGKSIYPKRTLIENVGFDGSGVHSTVTDKFNIFDDKMLKEIDFNNLLITQDLPSSSHIETEVVKFLEQTSKMMMMLKNE